MSTPPPPPTPVPPARPAADDGLSLAPLPPGESLEWPQPPRRELEPDLDVSNAPLEPSTAKTREQVELEHDPAKAERLQQLLEKAFANPPPPAPPEPWLQFTLRDLILVSTCMAVGLGLGRLDPTGLCTFALGWAAVGVGAFVLLSETKVHGWKVAMFSVFAGYIGAMLSAVLRVWMARAGP